jgi:fructokinase
VVDALAHLVVAVAYMVAPERIVLGGGVGSADGLLPLVRTASERLDGGYRSLDWDQLLVAPALGPDAALIGGLVLAQDAD